MEFCDICENMFFVEKQVEDEAELLVYKCKKCGNTKEIKNKIVSSMSFEKQEQYSIINKYTKFDPTLPVLDMPCKNEGCTQHEIIYVRYDNVELKYAYLCPKCDTIWKN
jgi:DNA-directed RNA polymerase subunit M/transcription elongation factor TFIIS